MKMTARLLCVLLAGLAPAAPAAELLSETFDAFPVGPIANQPGWTTAAWIGTQTGYVESVDAWHSPSNVLELHWNPLGCSAVFTNFTSTYTTAEHPVVRFSAKVRVDNTNTFFQLGLRNSAAGHFLSFQSTNGYGSTGFQYRDRVFFPLIPGRFVDVTVHYNRSNGHMRLDYDHVNRLPWTESDIDPVVHPQFNQFVLTRLNDSAQTTGYLLFDDVAAETFPPHAWAWWRCTALPNGRFVEQLGTFPISNRFVFSDSDRPGADIALWNGTGDYRNEGATRQLFTGNLPCSLSTSTSSQWTVETLFRIDGEEDAVAFLDWGNSFGSDTNGSWIHFGYNASFTSFYGNVRDAQQPDSASSFLLFGPYVPNGRWQHAALVKSNDVASLYLDGLLLTNRTLAAPSDGTYAFAPGSVAAIGRTLGNNHVVNPDTTIDEIRVSGKALAPSEFLQPSRPAVIHANTGALGITWELTIRTIPGRTYRVDTAAALGQPPAWQPIPGSPFVAHSLFQAIDIPSTPKTNFVRLVRQN